MQLLLPFGIKLKDKTIYVDFGYKGNIYFAEAGRSVEFWLSKAMNLGIH